MGGQVVFTTTYKYTYDSAFGKRVLTGKFGENREIPDYSQMDWPQCVLKLHRVIKNLLPKGVKWDPQNPPPHNRLLVPFPQIPEIRNHVCMSR